MITLERILDKLDAQDERIGEILDKLSEMNARIAVLETKQEDAGSGVKILGWIVTFCLSAAALLVSLLAHKS